MTPSNSKKILVIDDDPSICYFFQTILVQAGYQVTTETDAESALKMLRRDSGQTFDMAVVDLMMPGLTGYELLKKIQRIDYQEIPMILITARNLDPGTVELMHDEFNIWEFFNKPIDPKRFVTTVNDYFSGNR